MTLATRAKAVFGLAALLATAAAAADPGLAEVRVADDEVVAEIAVAGLEAELTVAFEAVLGLTLDNLGLSVAAVSPSDPQLLARMPALTSIPGALPLLVTIDPPETGGLAFSGLVSVGLYTHALTYAAGSPLRLFASHDGGPFEDVTESMGSGSYRVRGSKGDFSDFLILADLRPAGTVIGGKLDRLEGLLEGHAAALDPLLYLDLADLLAATRSHHLTGDPVAALQAVDAFADAVEQAPGSAAPDVWRSARDVANVAGQLRAAAATLHFSLALASNSL
jgi:hypothetical protein